jgi:DNA repair protein RadD
MQEAPEKPITEDGLRSYQKRAVRDVGRAWKDHRSVLLVEFMGAGKTVEAAEIIRQHVARGERVLVLAHRGEILKQTRRKLIKAGIPAESIGFIWADGALNANAPVQIASVMTLAHRTAPENIGLLVVDEAHHSQAKSWRKIFSWYPNAKVLGLTATPERLDGKPLREFFETMILGEPCESLIGAGWITQPEIWTREDAWRPTGLRTNGSDYSAKSAAKAMGRSTIVGGIPAAYLKHARGLPAVGFAATKDQATTLCIAFCAKGVASETLFDSHDEKQREAILKRLSSGKTSVIWTCDVISEGWDFPSARCVIMARPTASIARYMQWSGRCMRPGSRSIILDHAGNYAVHGPPWEDREWSLDGRPPPTKMVAQVNAAGGVSFLEPIEVAGRLVRADIVRRQTVCAGFGKGPCPTNKKPPKNAFWPSTVSRRHNEPWRCPRCGHKKGISSQTPEQLSERSRKAGASLTAEQRHKKAVHIKTVTKSLTHKQRSEMTRKGRASMSPEQRSTIARKSFSSMSKEQQRKLQSRAGRIGVQKVLANYTLEKRREAARKAWITRRKNDSQ